MIEINIHETSDGFEISLFDTNGPPWLDKNIRRDTYDDMVEAIKEWRKLETDYKDNLKKKGDKKDG